MANIPLQNGETVVSFRVTDLGTFVWFVERSQNGNFVRSFYRVPQDRSWLRQRVARIREVFNRAEPDQFRPAIAEGIFNALFPGEHASEILTAKNVIVIPDDCLFLLPLEVLSPSASAGTYPLLDVSIRYFPSTSALALARSLKLKRNWDAELLALGNPVTTGPAENQLSGSEASPRESDAELRSRGLSLDPLPGTEVEIKEITKLFAGSTKTDIRLGRAATKRGLLHTDLSRYRFLHFATHGLLPTESNLLEPALVFSRDESGDFFLQLSEVLNLRLSAESVVLSACNTGSGDVTKAEGVANLGRAFLLAGSSSTTVSLWQVSDDSTVLLMRRYYEGLLNGKPKAEALAAARSAVFKAGFTNPFFWSAFVLMGD